MKRLLRSLVVSESDIEPDPECQHRPWQHTRTVWTGAHLKLYRRHGFWSGPPLPTWLARWICS